MRTEEAREPTTEEFEHRAASFRSVVEGIDPIGLEAEAVDQLVATLRTVQSSIDGLLVRIGLRADALAAEGSGAPARDAFIGTGEVRGSTARREAARVALAARVPVVGSAMSSGRLGSDHLDALVRRLGRLDADQLERLDVAGLLESAHELPADTFDAALRRAVESTAQPDEAPDENEAARAESEVRWWFDDRTGRGHLFGQFDPERYEALTTALEQHMAVLAKAAAAGPGGPVQMNANLAAEALIDLVCSSGGRGPHLPHITVVVDQATLELGRHGSTVAETGDGHVLSDLAIARLCCDAVLRRVVLDESGVPIDVGRRHRTATSAQWAALRAVHSSCAWAGCDRPIGQCQAHHIRYWQHGGPTDLDNLVPLCGHHHHLVHEGRWHIELLPDRALRITRPDGQPHAITRPPTRHPLPPRPEAEHRLSPVAAV